MKRVKKIVAVSIASGFGLVLAGGLSGCNGQSSTKEQNQLAGAFVVIEEVQGGGYKILEEFPSAETRVVLKKLDGTEEVLTKEEMDALIAKEATKIDNGTSNLTNPNAQLSSGGMSLGEAILASAAGAIIGSWIGSKLFNNPAYQNQRQSAYKNTSSYQRSVNSFNNAKQGQTAKKSTSGRSGFFGGGSKSSSVGG
ncbi:UPF0323 family lipoprotein [Campylobacter corcagiensis]|uniref:UPF0323 domain-containing protein n=1 Tax=Campylobacter corcagiensis TaxID=1448857 RepID=A0A7M1LJX2_9BACT|nr:UPF0323 family lipoprotein [Campylobacter corcagiensis]QKF63963.1 putative lipoprotein [Campylobacter corcagiensis]QOQ87835.1 hypothetical protein IMC76_03260 [Campylobacter corcagiensis]